MIIVKFFTTLRVLIKIPELQFNLSQSTVGEILSLCEKRSPVPFMHKLIKNSSVIQGTIILVNGHNILHLDGLETEVNDGDQIALFPPGGGG